MNTHMIYGRHCSLLMCFTLSWAAQVLDVKFGMDERMRDVFVDRGNGKLVPGTIVGGDDADGWLIDFPYETNRGSELAADLSTRELSGRYPTKAIKTNLRFLNDEDIEKLKEIDEDAWESYQKILEFREKHKKMQTGQVDEAVEKAVWEKLVPILFEKFTTVDLEERKKIDPTYQDFQIFQNMVGRGGTDWHKDYNDMGFTMIIDDSFAGSPLIYWPGPDPQEEFKNKVANFPSGGVSEMFDIQAVQGGKYRVTSVKPEAYDQGMRDRDLISAIDDNVKLDSLTMDEMKKMIETATVITFRKNSRDTSSVTYEDLPHKDDPSKRTYKDMKKWCEERKMKIAPEGTKIALFEGKHTLHGRPPIPDGTMSSRGLAFYGPGKKKFEPNKRESISAKRKSSASAIMQNLLLKRQRSSRRSTLPTTREDELRASLNHY